MPILAALIIAAVIVMAFTPVVIHLSRRYGILKPLGERHIHDHPMPHLGGIALVIGIVPVTLALGGTGNGLFAYAAGGLMIAILGVVDDLIVLKPSVKFMGQVAAALAFALLGGQVQNLTNPFGLYFHVGWWGVPLSTIWIVAVVNAVNLIDGLDGLASGVTAIVAAALVMVAFHRHETDVVILAAATLGATAAFLRYNFAPAKIIMGDVGALFLGYTLGAMAVIGSVKDTTVVSLGAPMVALALPIFDTGFAIFRRVKNGQSLGHADRDHIHHRLLNRGLSQRRTVLILYGITALFGAVAVALVDAPRIGEGVGVVLVAAVLTAAIRWGLLRVPKLRQAVAPMTGEESHRHGLSH